MKNNVGFSRVESKFTQYYSRANLQKLKELASDKYMVVRPTKDVYDKTVQSWDNRPDTPFIKSGWDKTLVGCVYKEALEFLNACYGPLMRDPVMNPEEISETIDWSKSPGWPYTHYGFKTKQDVVNRMPNYSVANDTQKLKEPVYLNCAFKVEFLPTAEIQAGKGRIFQIPPLHLLYSQLKFGKKISLRMKMFGWSYYGFNPYAGGFNNLAIQISSKRWRGCYDVSGWDKYLCVLKDIYEILQKRADLTIDQVDEFVWMAKNSHQFFLKLIDGLVLFKSYGNASGSGTTTRDNILAHILIFATGLYLAYYSKYESLPTFDFVFKQVVALFGDDNVFSLDEEFSLLCDEKFLTQHLGQFGLKLKFFYGGYDYPLENLSFLGAHFKKIDDYWYPQYDTIRIATTMVYEFGGDKSLDLPQTIGKLFTLTVMSYPTQHWELFRSAYSDFISNREVLEFAGDSTVGGYLSVGVPDDALMRSFYQGLESGCEAGSVTFLQGHFTPAE